MTSGTIRGERINRTLRRGPKCGSKWEEGWNLRKWKTVLQEGHWVPKWDKVNLNEDEFGEGCLDTNENDRICLQKEAPNGEPKWTDEQTKMKFNELLAERGPKWGAKWLDEQTKMKGISCVKRPQMGCQNERKFLQKEVPNGLSNQGLETN
jgi:hypothetical protein